MNLPSTDEFYILKLYYNAKYGVDSDKENLLNSRQFRLFQNKEKKSWALSSASDTSVLTWDFKNMFLP